MATEGMSWATTQVRLRPRGPRRDRRRRSERRIHAGCTPFSARAHGGSVAGDRPAARSPGRREAVPGAGHRSHGGDHGPDGGADLGARTTSRASSASWPVRRSSRYGVTRQSGARTPRRGGQIIGADRHDLGEAWLSPGGASRAYDGAGSYGLKVPRRWESPWARVVCGEWSSWAACVVAVQLRSRSRASAEGLPGSAG